MTPKAVTIGVALALVGVLVGMNFPTVTAWLDGPYALSATSFSKSATFAWRINQQTGQVSVCALERPVFILAPPIPKGAVVAPPPNSTLLDDGVSDDSVLRPRCSPWSE